MRLTNIAFILSLKLLYQQGYIVIRGLLWNDKWTDMLKWSQNPKYYHINKKYNFGHKVICKNFIRTSEYKKYRCKELGACDFTTSS